MNKLIIPITIASILGLFSAYSIWAQTGTNEKAQQPRIEKQSQQHRCGTATKDFCCKTEKPKDGNCCACCTGSTCAAGGSHCCG